METVKGKRGYLLPFWILCPVVDTRSGVGEGGGVNDEG